MMRDNVWVDRNMVNRFLNVSGKWIWGWKCKLIYMCKWYEYTI